MAILDALDFKKITEVYSKILKEDSYYSDDNVNTYYNKLLNEYEIDKDYLPDVISGAVKKYLVHAICVEVAYYSIGSNNKQVAENIVIDTWNSRYIKWKAELNDLNDGLTATDFYDEDNLPEDTQIGNPNCMTWGRS